MSNKENVMKYQIGEVINNKYGYSKYLLDEVCIDQ